MQPAAQTATKNDIIFYDGTCGLCHGFVKWVLARDAQAHFQFAPLQGETIKERIPEEERYRLPDSVMVWLADERLLTKSEAALYVAETLGQQGWARLLRILPRPIADFGYDVIAKMRYALFGRKEEMCPLVPPELRGRFLP